MGEFFVMTSPNQVGTKYPVYAKVTDVLITQMTFGIVKRANYSEVDRITTLCVHLLMGESSIQRVLQKV